MQSRHENWKLEEVLQACDWDDQAVAVAAGHGLSNHGYVKISESSETSVILGSEGEKAAGCLLYTSPSPRDRTRSRMPSSA